MSGITTNALAQLGKNESVPIHTLEKVCTALNCNLEDIVEIFPDEELKKRRAVIAGDQTRKIPVNDVSVIENIFVISLIFLF